MRSNEYKYSSTSSRKRMTSSVFNASEDPNLFVINVKLPPQISPLQVPGRKIREEISSGQEIVTLPDDSNMFIIES